VTAAGGTWGPQAEHKNGSAQLNTMNNIVGEMPLGRCFDGGHRVQFY
jgi:hypothetical protein